MRSKSYLRSKTKSAIHTKIDCGLGINPFHQSGLTRFVRNDAMRALKHLRIAEYPQPDELHSRLAAAVRASYVDIPETIVLLQRGVTGCLKAICDAILRLDVKNHRLRVLLMGPEFELPVRLGADAYEYILEERSLGAADDVAGGHIDRFCAAIEHAKPDIVYLSNPNNPLGSFIDKERIRDIVHCCARAKAYVIVDEAYMGWKGYAHSAASLLAESERLVVMTSLSKFHCGANLRFGWAIANPAARHLFNAANDDLCLDGFTGCLAESILVRLHRNPKLGDKIRQEGALLKRRFGDVFKEAWGGRMEVLPTDPELPIFTVMTWDDHLDLWHALERLGIFTISGEFFLHPLMRARNSARVRIPGTMSEIDEVVRRLHEGMSP